MTLSEAYNEAYSLRNTELKGRFKYNFSMWKNGKGPTEDTQRRDLLKMGFSFNLKDRWIKPAKFSDLHIVTIVIPSNDLMSYIELSLKLSHIIITIGEYYKIHIAGSEKELKKIERKFGKPNKNK